MRAVCWGETPWGVRRLLTHVKHLPRDSAFVRAMSGDAAYWDEHVEMTAKVYDAVERNNYYLLKVNGNDPDAPEPFPRPGVSADPETISLTAFNDLIGG